MTNAATRAQIDAAVPRRSTWLSANAGSGKTRVLTDRVALLLLDGVEPQRILCLTYTKAAASEMQNRLFKRLGEWAMMEDAELVASLQELGVSPGHIHSDKLRAARVLFAKAIETPGGLKIQTIHSFCAALLRRFPVEAQVSPAFVEMDDRTGKVLRQSVLDQVAQDHPALVDGLAAEFRDEDIDPLLQEIGRQATIFQRPPDEAALRQALGLQPGDTQLADVVQVAFDGSERAIMTRALPVLAGASPTMVTLSETLSQVNWATPDLADLHILFGCFLHKKNGKPLPSAKLASIPVKVVRENPAFPLNEFHALMERVAQALDLQFALKSLRRSMVLWSFANVYVQALEQAKQQRGWLDFDDLIVKARGLLTDPSVASWVLFRLDGGIDHILVDEAQDTSPVQWDVVRLLAQDFTAGQSARSTARTVFVVGDQKQSIYSFQGADPAEFDRMRSYFEDRFQSINAPFGRRELLYSFRSAKPILQLVDTAFTPNLRTGLGDSIDHKAFKANLPGRVDLWDWIKKGKKEDDKPWYDPVDTVGSDHHTVELAKRIAWHIHTQIQHGQITEIQRVDGVEQAVTRPIRPRDFLILVRSRDTRFRELIRACKNLGLPMAGEDRLRVGGEVGVKDLIALLSFLETPQDDLSLAHVMRSPLGCVSEEALYDLAHGRAHLLWDALEGAQDRHPELYAMLVDLRAQADYMRPYDLLERALTHHSGRERLLARLGPEAADGIAAFLEQALNYEQSETPSLTGFLTWLAADDLTIKRQIDSEGDVIRVMTVHGAKGLEAPIVILPQTGQREQKIQQRILTEDGLPLWKTQASEASKLERDRIAAIKELDFQEDMRLLYVAMTRAESWLIVCGSGDPPNKDRSWYKIIEAGLQSLNAEAEGDLKLRLSHLDWPSERQSPQANLSRKPADPLPAMYQNIPAEDPGLPVLLSPSQLGGAKAVPGPQGLSEEMALARGTAIHTLLEHLAGAATEDRPQIAKRVLAQQGLAYEPDLFSIATRILDKPDLAHLFHKDALAEVDITAILPELGGHRISGAIDRLLISDDQVLAVDFKSNQLVPHHPQEVPEGLLRQMGAYGAALGQIYPQRQITLAILWTQTAELMTLPHDIVRQALLNTHIS